MQSFAGGRWRGGSGRASCAAAAHAPGAQATIPTQRTLMSWAETGGRHRNTQPRGAPARQTSRGWGRRCKPRRAPLHTQGSHPCVHLALPGERVVHSHPAAVLRAVRRAAGRHQGAPLRSLQFAQLLAYPRCSRSASAISSWVTSWRPVLTFPSSPSRGRSSRVSESHASKGAARGTRSCTQERLLGVVFMLVGSGRSAEGAKLSARSAPVGCWHTPCGPGRAAAGRT